jgi:CHAD domain-containing protein
MRDAGRRLSGLRDAQVLVDTLGGFKDELGRRPYKALRSRLEAARDDLAERAQGAGGATAEVADELEATRARIGSWMLEDESFASAAQGLSRIHRRGRKAMEAALEDGSDQAWHEWRKRVKDLWYSLRIVEPIAPTQLSGMTAEADELSDLLGDHNDLAVLLDAIDEHADALDSEQAAEARAAVIRRRDRLRLAAVPLGRRLYAEGSRGFARRLSGYWDARAAEHAAEASWIAKDDAEEIRSLLARKAAADGDDARRLGDALRARGFKVSEFAELVDAAVSDFGPGEFDELVDRGVIRVGEAPSARAFA